MKKLAAVAMAAVAFADAPMVLSLPLPAGASERKLNHAKK